MGTVYFTRHGQTVWNVENKICGATDSPLTDLGHEQAIELGKKILAEGIQIDEILYSPLIRAKATALHVSEITGIPAREEIRNRISVNTNQHQEMEKNLQKPNATLYVVLMEERQCFILHSVYIICLMI